MSFCKDCFTGVKHEGDAQGRWELIGGVNSYVATPSVDYPKDKVVLFLTDIFGPQFINNQLLADAFARNGFKTIMPDYFEGDPVEWPEGQSKTARSEWLGRHGPEKTRPLVDKVMKALEDQGIVGIGATGYCFGARYVVDLAFDNKIKVAAITHPSFLQIPTDLQKYAATKVPLLINSCTHDVQFPPEAAAQADVLLGDGKFEPGYKREHWEGCTHGFAVRGDTKDPVVKAAKEGAFKAIVKWYIEKL